jgi:hypothetical protein
VTQQPEAEGREHTSIEEVGAAQDKKEEAKKLSHRGTAAFTEAPAIVRDAPPASPLRFYARLRHQLESRGVNYDGLPRYTEPGQSPPCFKTLRVPFDAWLSSASMLGATVPYRYGMPGEPNYCYDCTKQFKAFAEKRGACKFPGTRFEHFRTLPTDSEGRRIPEVEILGVTRAERLTVDLFEAYDAWDAEQHPPGETS